jgi:UPF0716 family protein affecting phage T7 exclusion
LLALLKFKKMKTLLNSFMVLVAAQAVDVPGFIDDSATIPVVINTWVLNGFANATEKAWEVLSVEGTALDAIEQGCRFCEEL